MLKTVLLIADTPGSEHLQVYRCYPGGPRLFALYEGDWEEPVSLRKALKDPNVIAIKLKVSQFDDEYWTIPLRGTD
jgi:hypothetical protein